MPDLLFVHGVNVRGEAWFRGYDLIFRKLSRFLPRVQVHGCQWGDAYGAYLHRDGASIPGYDLTGNTQPAMETANRARWLLLADNPLLELRLLPDQSYIGEIPGPGIFALIPRLGHDQEVIRLLRQWSVADGWPMFIEALSVDLEWKSVIEAITQPVPAVSEKLARAVTAAFQRVLRSRGDPNLAGPERDQLKDSMVNLLGGPPLGIGDWFLDRLTNFGTRRRGGLSDAVTPGAGDIIRYQARGAEIRNFISLRVRETSASILLAHSLGGVACVDWLASEEYALSKGPKIQHLITVGSQAPYFYEIDGLVSRPFGGGLPDFFPKKWLNFYDRADLLSYCAEPIFPDHATDAEVDNGQPFPESHSAYWHNDRGVWDRVATFLEQN